MGHPTESHEYTVPHAANRRQEHRDSPPAYSEHALRQPQTSQRAYLQQLAKPIVIPATSAALGSPFLRAYPLSLESFHISRRDFLDILDGLNRVAVQNPPLRVLGLVGDVLGVVPLSTAQIVGFAVGTASKIGSYALSKGATEAYLRKVNKETFAPRGLKLEIAKLEAMARINNLPILDSSGEIRGDVRLLRPLLDPQEIQTRSATQRWLEALEPWIAPLDYETLPAINTDTTNLWGKMHTMASEHERKRAEEKALKNRSKAAEKHQEGIEKAEEKRAKELAKLERKEQKARDNSHSHKADDKLRRIEEKREKVERKHDERMDKAAERSTTKDKEAKAMTKVLWLMIRNLHDDSGVSYYGNMEEET